MLKLPEAVVLGASFTWAVKLAVPAAVGVPLIEPVEDSVSPLGKEPDVMLKV